jgi:hypothetical protein
MMNRYRVLSTNNEVRWRFAETADASGSADLTGKIVVGEAADCVPLVAGYQQNYLGLVPSR